MTSGKVYTPWIRPVICRHQPCPFEAGLTGDAINKKREMCGAASSCFENVLSLPLTYAVSACGTPADQVSAAEHQLQRAVFWRFIFTVWMGYSRVKLGWALLWKNLVLGFCKILYTLYFCPSIFWLHLTAAGFSHSTHSFFRMFTWSVIWFLLESSIL